MEIPFKFKLFQTWVERSPLSTTILLVQDVYVAYEYFPMDYPTREDLLSDPIQQAHLRGLFGPTKSVKAYLQYRQDPMFTDLAKTLTCPAIDEPMGRMISQYQGTQVPVTFHDIKSHHGYYSLQAYLDGDIFIGYV